MSNVWYPLLFTPISEEKSWGGTLLQDHYGRVSSTSNPTGISYELVSNNSFDSIIENGAFRGKPVGDLIKLNAPEFIGKKFKQPQPFPIVVKYIDTVKRLPLQVHPDASICHQLPGSKSNTKVWYVVNSLNKAKILVGIKRNCTKQQFLTRIKTPDLESIIQTFPSEPGDVYFISAGRVHAVDAGNLILSIEQNCDLGYSVSSWGSDFKEPKQAIHELDNALKCIHFQDRMLPRIRGESSVVKRNRKIPLITNCPYFTVDDLRLVYDLHDFTSGGSFHILTVIDHPVSVTANECTVTIEPGRSCLLPAALGRYSLSPVVKSSRILRTSLRTDR